MGCVVDLSQRCPVELRAGDACRSMYEVIGKPEFCCSGAYVNPATCRPSVYCHLFKIACPKSCSYAFNDATNTFTCSGITEYIVTFCPELLPSQKSSIDPPTPKTGEVMLEYDSWLASLATETASGIIMRVASLHQCLLIVVTFTCILLLL